MNCLEIIKKHIEENGWTEICSGSFGPKKIIELYLDDHDYDGLMNTDEHCGCGGDMGLFLCDESFADCVPAYENPCEPSEHCDSEYCDRDEPRKSCLGLVDKRKKEPEGKLKGETK